MVDWLIVYFISHAVLWKIQNTNIKKYAELRFMPFYFVVNMNSLIGPGASEILSLCMSIFEIVLISVRIYWNNFSNFYQKNEFIRIMVWEVKKNFKIHFKIAFSFCISCTLMLHDFPVVSVWCAWLRMHLLNLHFKLMKNEKIMISSALYRFNIVLCCLFLLIFLVYWFSIIISFIIFAINLSFIIY